MKRFAVIAAIVVLVLLALMGMTKLKIRAQRADVILDKLKRGRGDRNVLLMKLSLARGDSVPELIEVVRDRDADTGLRAEILSLLFGKYYSSGDDRILSFMRETLESPETAIRRAAVAGFELYGNDDQRLCLLKCVADPDPEIRRTVLTTLCARAAGGRGQKNTDPFWDKLAPGQRKELVESCKRLLPDESDAELLYLLRSVVGREIESLCNRAAQCVQSGDFEAGEKLLADAAAVDPESHQLRIRRARQYLAEGMKDRALAEAEKYGALLRVAMLAEAPVIDGDPTEAAWSKAFRYENKPFYHSTSRWAAKVAEGKTDVYIGHRDGTIYVATLGYEDDMNRLIVKNKERDGPSYQDECVEIFFDPGATASDMFQFVVNALGALYDGFRYDGHENFMCEYAAQVFRDRGYWACELAVPVKSLHDQTLEKGAVWGINVARSRIGPASECGSMWPLYGWNHRAEFYPLAVFEGLESETSVPGR